MKALTLIQPWAHAIAHWGKRVENRGWKPPEWIIGDRIAVHAGAKLEKQTLIDLVHADISARKPTLPVVRRAIISTAIVAGWIGPGGGHSGSLSDEEAQAARASRWYIEGQVGWVLKDVLNLPEPIPCNGRLGLWDAPEGSV